VIVSDQRLDIEIITPKLDMTLNADRYNMLDQRLVLSALATFNLGAGGSRSETSLTQGRLIAKGMENRRNEIADDFVRQVVSRIVKQTAAFTSSVRVGFTPKQITVDMDATIATMIQNARNTRDLSRQSYLEYLGFDERVEAEIVKWEREEMDDVFKTVVPHDSPDNQIDAGDGNSDGADPAPGVTDKQRSSSTAKSPGQDRGGRPRAGTVKETPAAGAKTPTP
jgi:hypothetical protein